MSDQKEVREEVVASVRMSFDKAGRWLKEVWPEAGRPRRWSKVARWLVPDAPTPELVNSAELKYQEAVEFFQSFAPDSRVDYSCTVEYLKCLHTKLEESDRSQDEKADAIIKYLGGGSAIVTAGALLSLKLETRVAALFAALTIVSLVPYIVYSFYAIRCAVSCRKPRETTTMPDATVAIKIAHHYAKEFVEINQMLILHPMNEALLFRTMQKSKEVEKAHTNYIRAIASLLVPVGFVTLSLLVFSVTLPDRKDDKVTQLAVTPIAKSP